jgi:hypothetical protein
MFRTRGITFGNKRKNFFVGMAKAAKMDRRYRVGTYKHRRSEFKN